MAGMMFQFGWEVSRARRSLFWYLGIYIVAMGLMICFFQFQNSSISALSRKLYGLQDEVLGLLALDSRPGLSFGHVWILYLLQLAQIASLVFAMKLGIVCMTEWENSRIAVYYMLQPVTRLRFWWKKILVGILVLLLSNVVLLGAVAAGAYWISMEVYRIRFEEVFRQLVSVYGRLLWMQVLLFLLMGGISLSFRKQKHSHDVIFYYTILAFLLNALEEIVVFSLFVMHHLMHLSVNQNPGWLHGISKFAQCSAFYWVNPLQPVPLGWIGMSVSLLAALAWNAWRFLRREIRE